MIIPPNSIRESQKPTADNGSEVQLKSSHLIIDHVIANKLFGNELNVHVVYYPERHSLMVAPKSDELFKSLHKANQHMLKEKNLKGDRTIALHELIIDHDIDERDRDLPFDVQPELGILNVKL